MAAITLKKLQGIEKSLEGIFADDPDTLGDISKQMAGLKAAIEKGETLTMADLSDILGDVVVEKAVNTGTDTSGVDDAPIDPLAPILKSLYDAIFDDKGAIRKGMSAANAQPLFEKAYHEALGELDGAIEAATEATAIELGQGGRVVFGKARQQDDATGKGRRGRGAPAEEDEDGDMDDMEKLLKSLGAPAAVIKKMGQLQSRVDQLETENALETFGKQAVEIGEPEAFGADLFKLHKIDPKLAETVKKRLAGKNAALKKAKVWGEELGGGGGTEVSAYDRLVVKANELVEKGSTDAAGKKLTFAKAFTEACNRNPELYAEHNDEQRRRQVA